MIQAAMKYTPSNGLYIIYSLVRLFDITSHCCCDTDDYVIIQSVAFCFGYGRNLAITCTCTCRCCQKQQGSQCYNYG